MAEKGNDKTNRFFKLSPFKLVFITAVLSIAAAFSTKDYIWGKLKLSTFETAFPNFEVIEVKRTVDLTKWVPTLSKNPDELSGKAIFDDWYTIRKIRDEGKEFCIVATSSGSNPKFTSQTHSITQKPIDLQLEGWGMIKSQELAILDVSKEQTNKQFDANFQSIRYRGFVDTIDNWCSVAIFHPTQKLTFRVNFPKNKMGNNFRFSTSFFYNRNDFRIIPTSSAHYKIDSTSLVWTVDNPISGYAYRIDWCW